MNTLYYSPGACSLSVHIMLEWVGKPYSAVQVSYADAEYQKLNPAGQVPALDAGDGNVLTQCSAILAYLAHTHPAAALAGNETPLGQAQLGRWSAFFTGDVHPAFFPVFMPQRYTTADDETSLANVRAAGTSLVRKRLDLLDAHLLNRTYIVGNSRTYVDAYSVPMIRWASLMLPGGLASWPGVKAHHERMLADVGVKQAMRDEGLI
ncbi:glutathione S-transferase family protein [Pseudomonas sp. MF6755]|uniref:glutathione S-transferase family protein n=1 Tax=Pseudomonas sp. MF6755 TaxID=2797530 RepID=UPI0018E6F3E5|nr:glutathione S-transferase family protein [Pseudomonas sp. MF6755]MBJ2285840.1 glutathione S-transferase family protein [Pseudomonas sp. MF6755]